MGDLGLHGIRRTKSFRTTRSAPKDQRPADLVRHHFEAFAPGGLSVADIPP
jgi:putative transposase